MTPRIVRCDICEDPLRSDAGPTVFEIPEADEAEQRRVAEMFVSEHRNHHVEPEGVTFTVEPPFASGDPTG